MSTRIFAHQEALKPTAVAGRIQVTSVRITVNPRHATITVWNRGGNAGTLTVDAEDGMDFVNKLLPPKERREIFET